MPTKLFYLGIDPLGMTETTFWPTEAQRVEGFVPAAALRIEFARRRSFLGGEYKTWPKIAVSPLAE